MLWRREKGASGARAVYRIREGKQFRVGRIRVEGQQRVREAVIRREVDIEPGDLLRREEMAELLVRTFGYDNPGGTDFFVDDESSVFQESINKLANHDITKGCNPPANDEFCPDENLGRAQMATFLARALELGT